MRAPVRYKLRRNGATKVRKTTYDCQAEGVPFFQRELDQRIDPGDHHAVAELGELGVLPLHVGLVQVAECLLLAGEDEADRFPDFEELAHGPEDAAEDADGTDHDSVARGRIRHDIETGLPLPCTYLREGDGHQKIAIGKTRKRRAATLYGPGDFCCSVKCRDHRLSKGTHGSSLRASIGSAARLSASG